MKPEDKEHVERMKKWAAEDKERLEKRRKEEAAQKQHEEEARMRDAAKRRGEREKRLKRVGEPVRPVLAVVERLKERVRGRVRHPV